MKLTDDQKRSLVYYRGLTKEGWEILTEEDQNNILENLPIPIEEANDSQLLELWDPTDVLLDDVPSSAGDFETICVPPSGFGYKEETVVSQKKDPESKKDDSPKESKDDDATKDGGSWTKNAHKRHSKTQSTKVEPGLTDIEETSDDKSETEVSGMETIPDDSEDLLDLAPEADDGFLPDEEPVTEILPDDSEDSLESESEAENDDILSREEFERDFGDSSDTKDSSDGEPKTGELEFSMAQDLEFQKLRTSIDKNSEQILRSLAAEIKDGKYEISVGKAEISAERDEIRAERSRISAERNEIRAERSRISAERNEISTKRSRISIEKHRFESEVRSERNEIEREKTELKKLKKHFKILSSIVVVFLVALTVVLIISSIDWEPEQTVLEEFPTSPTEGTQLFLDLRGGRASASLYDEGEEQSVIIHRGPEKYFWFFWNGKPFRIQPSAENTIIRIDID